MNNEVHNNCLNIGLVAHSYEGASLCFKTMCIIGESIMGGHMHPNIVMSSTPMGLSMNGWQKDNYDEIGTYLLNGIHQVDSAGAKFFICPDNTAHIVLEKIIEQSPLPGLHIADVVCKEIIKNDWKKIGILGTKWTMNGTVYKNRFEDNNLIKFLPEPLTQERIDIAIFNNLCKGDFSRSVVKIFREAIQELKYMGAECVILGCTEILLIINDDNSSLPVLDSTRLLGKYAVEISINNRIPTRGWIKI
ncbi:MAG: aspartate/glutamate racemase family protein [Xanthomarina gelatinilytica]|uniref:aspartate/glutamate racemase family protein n=1 Tax=Xanthomarina gelatinilytica TaxID=1137281 RepID=UPI003A8904B8